MQRSTLLCCAYHFGYGPAAKLLHIARKLAGGDLQLIFLGTGVSHELASRSDLFDDVIRAEPDAECARRVISSCDAMLNLMDRAAAKQAQASGKPVYVVDSLAWMRDGFTPEDRHAKRYWVQRFVEDEKCLTQIGPNAQFVGPIVSGHPQTGPSRNGPVVVNLGGCESPLGSAKENPVYADFILSALNALEPGTVLLAGDKCVQHVRDRIGKLDLDVKSLPHEQALREIANAGAVLTSPGLTATFECFHEGVPTYFLPPQNYSQWWILKHLRERDLAPHAFHWEDVFPNHGVKERMSVAERTERVLGTIESFAGESFVRHRLRQSIEAMLHHKGSLLADRQTEFVRSLGECGTDTIAETLRREICDHTVVSSETMGAAT